VGSNAPQLQLKWSFLQSQVDLNDGEIDSSSF
jgi:hypothetical protein